MIVYREWLSTVRLLALPRIMLTGMLLLTLSAIFALRPAVATTYTATSESELRTLLDNVNADPSITDGLGNPTIININTSLIFISSPLTLTITTPNPNGLIIQSNSTEFYASGDSQILSITGPGDVSFHGIDFSFASSPTDGGAVSILNANVSFTNCNFAFNISAGNGGAIYFEAGSGAYHLVLAGSDFSFNEAQCTWGGGAIYLTGGLASATITASYFDFNDATAGPGGALIAYITDALNISKTSFSFNTAATHGGGINVIGGTGDSVLTNDTFSFNSAGGNGGGMFLSLVSGQTFTIEANSLSFNSAQGAGGGIYSVIDPYGQPPRLHNSTLAFNNVATSAPRTPMFGTKATLATDSDLEGAFDATFNFIRTSTGAVLNDPNPDGSNPCGIATDSAITGSNFGEGLDPKLGDFGDYGIDSPSYGKRPNADSPVLGCGDTINNDPMTPATDQRDQPRPTDVPIDIGSMQVQGSTSTPLIENTVYLGSFEGG